MYQFTTHMVRIVGNQQMLQTTLLPRHQQTLPTLLAIWSKHFDNTVKITFHFGYNIVIQYGENYKHCDNTI